MDREERIAKIDINIESQNNSLKFYIKFSLEKGGYQNFEELTEKFIQEHQRLTKIHEKDDKTNLARFYRHIQMFKPALNTILDPGKDYDGICDYIVQSFNVVLDRIRRQVNDKKTMKKKKGPIIPGMDSPFELRYVCTVCNKNFKIPPEIKEKIENSNEKIELPKHHDKEMIIKIIRLENEKENINEQSDEEEFEEIKILPAEVLMNHSNTADTNAEYLKITSVGIDVGSSTSHLIFSKLTLKRETSFFNMTNRFILINREIIYEGNILFTPLIDKYTIDIDALVEFFKDEYKKARITPEEVDTGAVIVTGETAKKKNADEIIQRLSSESGKFVSASAGPNFESLLGIMGSGIVKESQEKMRTIMNVDVGGGTSNIAISSKGDVTSTSCINVGGRLLGIDENFKIWRIDEPTELLMEELNMNYKIGDIIDEKDVKVIVREYTKALIEVMRGPANSKVAKMLMMTDDLDFSIPVDDYSFSGGVAEFLYSNKNGSQHYRDIGKYLADEIKLQITENNMNLIEPENKIRATVIGAGAFSLSVSGSTCYYDDKIQLPITNVPVVPINVKSNELYNDSKIDECVERIHQALNNFNLVEGEDLFALYFKGRLARANIESFAKIIEKALPNSIARNKMKLVILKGDGGKMLGLTLKKLTSVNTNLFCLDELELEAGDWIDVGLPLETENRKAFPVTIKSLVFNNSIREKNN